MSRHPLRSLVLLVLVLAFLVGCPTRGRGGGNGGDDDDAANDDDSALANDDDAANDDDSALANDDDVANDDDSALANDDDVANDDDSGEPESISYSGAAEVYFNGELEEDGGSVTMTVESGGLVSSGYLIAGCGCPTDLATTDTTDSSGQVVQACGSLPGTLVYKTATPSLIVGDLEFTAEGDMYLISFEATSN